MERRRARQRAARCRATTASALDERGAHDWPPLKHGATPTSRASTASTRAISREARRRADARARAPSSMRTPWRSAGARSPPRTSSSPPADGRCVPPIPGAELGITSDGFFELERAARSASRSSAAATSPSSSPASSPALGVAHHAGAARRHGCCAHFDAMLGRVACSQMLREEGVQIVTRRRAARRWRARARRTRARRRATAACSGRSTACCGRSAASRTVEDLGLERAGVALDAHGFVATDAYQTTSVAGRLRHRRRHRARAAHAGGDRRRPAARRTACSAARATAISTTRTSRR